MVIELVTRHGLSCRFFGVFLLTLFASPALAATWQPIEAGKLRIVERRGANSTRFDFRTSRDPGVVPAEDPTIHGATLLAAGTTGRTPLLRLPAANWRGLGRPAGSKGYRYSASPGAVGGVSKILLRPGSRGGRILIKARGAAWPWVPDAPQGSVRVELAVRGDRFCAEAGGIVKSDVAGRFEAVRAPAPATCPEFCGNGIVEGDEKCDDGNLNDDDGCTSACVMKQCSGASANLCVELTIAPSEVDPTADDAYGDHLVFGNGNLPLRDELYVFLPSSGGEPANMTAPLYAAALQGVRVIGLAYSNTAMVLNLCATDPDPDCQEKLRLERIYGDDHSNLVSTNPVDAIVPRLKALLAHLSTEYPTLGFDAYLDPAGELRWEKLILAGHSQGAGHSALIARDHVVARVIMYGNPFDYDQTQPVVPSTGTYTPVGWILDAHATPSDHYFGLTHVLDNDPYTYLCYGNWDELGVPGDHVDVDSAGPPYLGSHQFTTATTSGQPHPIVRSELFYREHAWLCCSY